MGCGMVRRVDELGRVVIPKEMRRILNIKSGSSVEMSINDNNQIVLEKFFEINNIYSSAENLANIIYEELLLPCLICDDEKIIICKGVNKKEFLNKSIVQNIKIKNKNCEELTNFNLVQNQVTLFDYTYIFTLTSDGFDSGFLVILSKEKLSENTLNNVNLLNKFLCSLLKF